MVDIYPIICAVSRATIHDEASRKWLQAALSGSIQLSLRRIYLFAFLRVTTHPRIFAVPLQPNQALGYGETWLTQPLVNAVAPDEGP